MKMSLVDSDAARRLWDEWNTRVAVLLSLSFQMLLVCLAYSRRRSGGLVLATIIWLSYLLADWIAAFAVGLISSGESNDCPEKTAVNKQLAAFWAPFLLLHLGGPDSITAFALEDNELWIRHLLGLVIQLVAVVYVFVQSMPNKFWIPTALVFSVGACKYAERTVALYHACLGNFKRSLLSEPDPGPNYAQLMEEFSVLEASHVPVKIDIVKETEKGSVDVHTSGEPITPEPLDDLDIVLKGYDFFETFKGLIVDHMFSFHERNKSRMFVFSTTAADAFKVMEVELNFIYDVLYTKIALVHCKIGYLCRFLCTLLLAVCLQQFISLPKHDMILFDKITTYILLAGAIGLDFVGQFKLVFSDWSIISAKKWVAKVLIGLPFGKREQRWSNAMAQFSFISFCLKEQRPGLLNRIADVFRFKDALHKLVYKKEQKCEEKLKEFVFVELKDKAAKAKTIKEAKEIYSARGDYVLCDYPKHYSYPSICDSLGDEAEYDESLLLWHIATELCYFKGPDPSDEINTDGDRKFSHREYRGFCKVLSDYMLYLLVMQPTFMSSVAGIAKIRFQDTCEEAKKFFRRWQMEKTSLEEACKKLLEVKTVVKPNQVKGDRSKSLLFDACILAKDLKKLNDDRRWEMMSRIWVELLSYGASRCRGSEHARQLSQGGEFVTFVWLLMVHFGLGEQFRIEAGHARAKLLVGELSSAV